MKILSYLLLLSILTLGCNSEDRLEADIELMKSLEESVFRNYEANAELAELVGSSEVEELRELVRKTFSNLFQMEEHSIAATGGYEHIEPLADRKHILNSELKDAPSFIRNNPYGIDLNYVNRISEYLNENGFSIEPAFDEPSNESELDYFDKEFGNKNIFQILIVFHQIKLTILYQERLFLQSKLKEYVVKSDSL